jgi:hypothetical protein
MTPLKVKQKLQSVLIQIKDQHWNRVGFEHKYLGDFYDSFTDLIDLFIETYAGKYGREVFQGYINIDSFTGDDWRKILTDLMVYLNTDMNIIIDPLDTDLQNIVADMKQLVNHTFYFLPLK